jgi:predicted metal-dependent hydrolase
MLCGEPHRLDWQPARPRRVEIAPGRISVGGPLEGLEGRVVRALRGQALALLDKETREMAAAGGLQVARVGIGDPRSRWGSCSNRGTIRYSWRLLMAPPFVRRATVAHEVAHLAHLNHGPQFHRLVEQLLGADPAPARRWLRQEGRALHAIGTPPTQAIPREQV